MCRLMKLARPKALLQPFLADNPVYTGEWFGSQMMILTWNDYHLYEILGCVKWPDKKDVRPNGKDATLE